MVSDHLIPCDERAVAGVELIEEVVAGRALCLFDEIGDIAYSRFRAVYGQASSLSSGA